MTGAMLGAAAVPEALRALIADKAEGNPFFVEELVRSLLEDGSLRRDDGRIVAGPRLEDLTVPDTIQDVLIARIDRLAEDVAAGDPGRVGDRPGVRAAAAGAHQRGGDRIRSQVEDLRSLELIYEKALHPELAYMFKHALTHDVAYESVVAERRTAPARHHRPRHRGAVRRSPGRARRDAGAPLRAAPRTGSAPWLSRAVGRQGRRRRTPTAPSSRTAARRWRSPTRPGVAARRRARAGSRSGSGWRASTSATSSPRPPRTRMPPPQRRRRDARHASRRRRLQLLLGRTATTTRSAATTRPSRSRRSAHCRRREAFATTLHGFYRGVARRRARRLRARVARRPADLRAHPHPLVEAFASFHLMGRRVDAATTPPRPPTPTQAWRSAARCAAPRSHLLRLGFSARRAAAPATRRRAHAARGRLRPVRPHRRPRLEEPHAQHPRLVLRRDAQRRPRPRVQRGRRGAGARDRRSGDPLERRHQPGSQPPRARRLGAERRDRRRASSRRWPTRATRGCAGATACTSTTRAPGLELARGAPDVALAALDSELPGRAAITPRSSRRAR